MNCIVRFTRLAKEKPDQLAIWTEKHGVMTLAELLELASRAQALFRERGVGPGDHVLLAALPGPGMFAAIVACLGLGAPVVLIEPWLPVERIDHVLKTVQPKVFFTGLIGKLWGFRIPEVRKIPHWETESDVRKRPARPFHVEELSPEQAAVIAFSSGTTGKPKGSVRTQGYMWLMHDLLVKHAKQDHLTGPDLAVFANVALFHLGTGRGAVLVPSRWKKKSLLKIASLPEKLRPASVSCGPAFLKTLLTVPGFESIQDFHVGGALTDRWIFEEAFRRWPDAHFAHVYGGSEAEPVAYADARDAVRLSRERGLFQSLYVGKPIPEIRSELAEPSVWVSGPNVAPEYIGSPEDNLGVKRRDADGRLWHCMGDRIAEDAEGWWYAGRAFQSREDFALEQKIYAFLDSSAAFLHRNSAGRLYLLGNPAHARADEVKRAFPELAGIHPAPIVRDRRHRARVDRKASLAKAIKKSKSLAQELA